MKAAGEDRIIEAATPRPIAIDSFDDLDRMKVGRQLSVGLNEREQWFTATANRDLLVEGDTESLEPIASHDRASGPMMPTM